MKAWRCSSTLVAARSLQRAPNRACYIHVHVKDGRGRELRQNLSRYLRDVERGERLLVTDRNRPVAELGPPATSGADLDRLIAEGRVTRPIRRGLPKPLALEGDPYALSRALDEVRREH